MANTTRRNWQMPLQQTDTNASIEQERDRYESGMRVSWGGIWAGVLVALGTLLLLSTLGLAVGIAAGNAGAGANAVNNAANAAANAANNATGGNGVTAGTVGTAAVIWSALSLLISLFLGGLASTRMGRIWDRATGMFHGALVWVITLGTILYLAMRGLGLMGSASSMGIANSGAAGTAGRVAAENAPAIGWSPFIIAALSLLAALAGAAAGLRHLLDRTGSGFSGSSSGTGTSSTTTTTTTTGNNRDRYTTDKY